MTTSQLDAFCAALPRRSDDLNPAQVAEIIKRQQWPASITKDPRRLKSNLEYFVQVNQQAIDNQERDTKGRRQLRLLLETDPVQLLAWPPVSLWTLIGWIVRPNSGDSGAAAIKCDYEEAAKEQARWIQAGGAEHYKALIKARKKEQKAQPD